MGIFASNGRIEKDYSGHIDTVRAAIEHVVAEKGHHLSSISEDKSRYEITTTRTLTNWGTAIAVSLTRSSGGTHAVFDFDNVAGSPSALLDGRKNTKTITRFLEDLDAAV